MSTDRIVQLRAELAELEAAEKATVKAADAVVPKFTFDLAVDDLKFDKLFDPSVIAYRLSGTCTNAEELAEVGRSHSAEGGGMVYLFNTLSGRFIMSHGGGRVYLSKAGSAFSTDLDKIALLEAFVAVHPEGGDVTDIVRA